MFCCADIGVAAASGGRARDRVLGGALHPKEEMPPSLLGPRVIEVFAATKPVIRLPRADAAGSEATVPWSLTSIRT